MASGVWGLRRRAQIGGRNGGSWALSSFFILVWLAVARGGDGEGWPTLLYRTLPQETTYKQGSTTL